MLFALQTAALDGTEACLNALDRILVRVENEVHELEVARADELEGSRWYQTSRPVRQKLLQQIAKASVYRAQRIQGPHLRRVEVVDEATAHIAGQLAFAPLLVVMENDVSDGALVEAALKVLASPATVELSFGAPSRHEPPAMILESRGGHGELVKLIQARLEEAVERGRPPRLVVVADSDGEWPGDVKEHARDLRDQCSQAKVPCPPLNKRTAENYIPDEIWRAWAAVRDHTSARPAIEALLRLSPQQRDHVHLAKATNIPWDPTKPLADALFAGVSSADSVLLLDADLKGRNDRQMILALKKHAAALTRADLLARDHQGDLLALVRQIEDEL